MVHATTHAAKLYYSQVELPFEQNDASSLPSCPATFGPFAAHPSAKYHGLSCVRPRLCFLLPIPPPTPTPPLPTLPTPFHIRLYYYAPMCIHPLSWLSSCVASSLVSKEL